MSFASTHLLLFLSYKVRLVPTKIYCVVFFSAITMLVYLFNHNTDLSKVNVAQKLLCNKTFCAASLPVTYTPHMARASLLHVAVQ